MIIIGGATATGKSKLALQCAKEIGAEIISMDSMQIYKHMDIGTAKVDVEQEGIKHHMIDIKEPWEEYSVAEYKLEALSKAKEITASGKKVIFVGGTGLYASALLYPFDFGGVEKDPETRALLEKELEQCGANHLYEKLYNLDKAAAKKVHPNNVRRVIRSLEIALTGKRTEHKKEQDPQFMLFALDGDRALLYERINQRVEQMRKQGLEFEVERVLQLGVDYSCQSMQAIGYKEWQDTALSKAEVYEKIKQNTRKYAKRQRTWFRQYAQCIWLDIDMGIEALKDVICNNYYKKQAKV